VEKFLSLEIFLEGRMPEYEIEIVDYIKILWRRKWLILLGTLLVVLITGGVSFLMTKTYQSTGIVKLGKIEGVLIDSPNIVRARIEYTPYAAMFIKSSGVDMSKKDLRLNIETRGNTGYIRLSAKSSMPDVAPKFIQYIVDDIASSQQEKIGEFLELIEQNKKELEQWISSLEESIQEMEELKRKKATSAQENTRRFVIQNALAEKENLLWSIKSRYSDLKMRAIKTQTFETHLLFQKTPQYATQPNTRLNLLVALIVGLMIFMAISLFLEYNKRDRHNTRKIT
jgi:uncharacterized protein involved in exopolysaccharide biosynthesis